MNIEALLYSVSRTYAIVYLLALLSLLVSLGIGCLFFNIALVRGRHEVSNTRTSLLPLIVLSRTTRAT